MSPVPDPVQYHGNRHAQPPFESWIRQSLRSRFGMVGNENLPPEILLEIEDHAPAACAPVAGRTGTHNR